MESQMDLIWEEAVLHVLGSHYPSKVSLQTIYFDVGKFRKLTENNFEINKYGQIRYQHTVRAILNILVKEGMAERIGRGVYVLKE